jgi:outer membrane protein assembly factor BamB
LYAPVVAADGTLYFGLRSGLHAVDPRGPRLLRERTAPLERVMSPPALGADGTIYLVATGQPVPVMAPSIPTAL